MARVSRCCANSGSALSTEPADPPPKIGGSNAYFELDMGIFRLKFTMNFLMNFSNHLQIIAALLLGGWWVYTERLEIGGVVAFISAIGRLNDPWATLSITSAISMSPG